MRILITGAKGQLGSSLIDRLNPSEHEIQAHDIDTLDLRDARQVERLFSEFSPEVVINTAAYTAVDKAESEPEAAELLNHGIVCSLVGECVKLNARLIHVSTDFVFDGNQNVPYQTMDRCAPLNVYGQTKRRGEEAILGAEDCDGLIIRTAWLYSRYGNNFVKSMLRLMQERPELKVVYDQIGTPTAASSLAGLILRGLRRPTLSGIYHWTDAGVASWYDFAVAIKEEASNLGLLDRDVRILPIRSREYPTPAQRPAFSVLDKAATQVDFEAPAIHWRETLREVLRDIQPDQG